VRFNPPPPKCRSFDKTEPNSLSRGKYIRNNLIRIRVSLICKLSEPLTRGLPPPDPRSLCPLSSIEFVEPPPEKKILGTPLVLRVQVNGVVVSYVGRAVHEFDCRHATNRAPLKRAVGSNTDLNILINCFSFSLVRRYGNPYTVKIKAVLVSRRYVQFDG
jgi:hypothetical protein